MQELSKQLKKDKGLRLAWSANIAMAFKDTYDQHAKKKGSRVMNQDELHDIANEAAEHFLTVLCR